MHQSHYTFSVDDALQQAFNRAARQHNHDALQSWIQALGGYHPAAEIEIEFERDKSLPRTIEFD